MRKLLLSAGIAILCLPMLFVIWLLLASRWSRMDAATMQAPPSLRKTIAEMVLQKADYGKESLPALDRALRLDPQNGDAWSRRCGLPFDEDTAPSLKDCEAAVQFNKGPYDCYRLGRAQDALNNPCTAEDSFTQATSATASNPDYTYIDSMGRAALRCGHLPAGRAGLETAIELEEKSLKDPEDHDDEIADTKKDMLTDREYLIVLYNREHENTLAAEACSATHPDWKSCNCDLDPKGLVACAEGQSQSKR